MFQVFSLDIFHSNMQESDTIMKCVLRSCEVLELDFKISLKMRSFKSTLKSEEQQIIVGLCHQHFHQQTLH